jgi:two-component system chemotaxis response regulator CheV
LEVQGMGNDSEILLESGTNEMNLMEILVRGQSYGINVLKIKEVMVFDKSKVTGLPEDQSHPSIVGMYRFRDMVLPLIDLAKEVKKDGMDEVDPNRQVVLIAEFNDMLNGFLIDEAVRIHRLSWEKIQPPSEYLLQYGSRITGVTHIKRDLQFRDALMERAEDDNDEEIQVLILDMEQIIDHIFPEYSLAASSESLARGKALRSDRVVAVAEDSSMIRRMMVAQLNEAGYKKVKAYSDGQEALDAWMAHKRNSPNELFADLMVTDIEMPRMDGLTLCRRLKKEQGFPAPVVIFSSLINQQISIKCDEVGADAYRSKPRLEELINVIDGFLGNLT